MQDDFLKAKHVQHRMGKKAEKAVKAKKKKKKKKKPKKQKTKTNHVLCRGKETTLQEVSSPGSTISKVSYMAPPASQKVVLAAQER